MEKYVKKVWLNNEESASTGSICVFDGPYQYKSSVEPTRDSFVEVKDCHGGVRLHRCYEDSEQDFLLKVEKLRDTLIDFAAHLRAQLNAE